MIQLPNARPASEPPDYERSVYATNGRAIWLVDYIPSQNQWLTHRSISMVGITHWCELADLESRLREASAREFVEWIRSVFPEGNIVTNITELLRQFNASRGEG